LLNLPPLIPALDFAPDDPGSPAKRIANIILQGFSVFVHATENELSQREKERLAIAFEMECQVVLRYVSDIARGSKIIGPDKRLTLQEDFASLLRDLADFVEDSLYSTIFNCNKYLDIFFRHVTLMQRLGLISDMALDRILGPFRPAVEEHQKGNVEKAKDILKKVIAGLRTRNTNGPVETERRGKPDGKPGAPPELNDTEQNIIEALNTSTLTGEKLCNKAGYPYNSNFKSTLSSLRKRGILGNKSPGYFLEPQYRFLLDKSDQGQD